MHSKVKAARTLLAVFILLAFMARGSALVFSAGLTPDDAAAVEQAVLELNSIRYEDKQKALAVLKGYGEAAFPIISELMQKHRGEDVFIGYELVGLAEQYGEAGIPIIAHALSDPNPSTRQRAARAAFTLGPKAADLADELVKLVADAAENSNVRTQAIDALRVIGIVNDEVKRGLALALAADSTLAWRANQAITALKIDFDTVNAVLFDELGKGQNIFGIVSAIAGNLHKASYPLEVLRAALARPSHQLERNLWLLIDTLFPRMANSAKELADLMRQAAETSSGSLKEQAIYGIGELLKYDDAIASDVLRTLSGLEEADEDYLLWIWALEKAQPDQPEVVEFFVNTLLEVDPGSANGEQIMLAAARYLEHCGSIPEGDIISLLDNLNRFGETVIWRLSPVFHRAAAQSAPVLEGLQKLAGQQDGTLKVFALSVLSAAAGTTAPVSPGSLATRIPAFPGAEGYGKYTVGGRGGKVYVVTNLNDSGPGSLRAAVQASGPRIVVFAVSGNILLKSPLDITNPYITIAGQTAPGEGITISGAPVNIRTHQVIIRYIRVRLGDFNNYESDALGGRGVSDVIIDHVSASWSVDECVSFYEVENVTVQWSFITESLRGSLHAKGNHGYGGIWGGHASFHHNLLAHHSSRNPRIGTQTEKAVDIRNNVIYNWGFNSAYGGENGLVNLVANYYKQGPGTNRGSVSYRIVEISDGGQWYIADNYMHGYPEVTADNWAGGVQPRLDRLADVRHETEFPVPYVATHTAEEAYELVLAHGGASLPARDAIDRRIVEEVRDGTATYGGLVTGLDSGIIDSQEDVGGLVFLRSFRAPLDSDQDGIPDWWVIKHGFTPYGGLDQAGDLDSDGYTNIEEYLNGTDPKLIDTEEAKSAVSQLIQNLAAADYEVRTDAEKRLEALHEAALPALAEVMGDLAGDNSVLRGMAARILARIKSPKTLPILLFTIANDPDSFVKVNALGSLAKLMIADPEVLRGIYSALQDPDEEVRMAAASALGEFGPAAKDYAVDLLLMSFSSDARVAWQCRLAAGKIVPGIMSFGDEVIEEAINRLPSAEWQDLAVTALARNAAKTLPRIIEIIFDPNKALAYRVPALMVLEKSGTLGEDMVERLVSLATDGKESLLVRIGATNVLAAQDESRLGVLKDVVEEIVAANPLGKYVYNNRIPIQVGNFALEEREHVLVRAVIGIPAEFNIGDEDDFTVEDQSGRAVYFEFRPITYWDDKHVRTAEITFYPNLAAQEQTVFFVNLAAKNAGAVRPSDVDTGGQVRVRIPEAGLELISTPRLESGERWMTQLVVAQDGSGNFTSVQAAVDAVPGFNQERVIIYITEGFYHEKIIVPADKNKITFIGENRDTTILNFNETPYVQYSTDSQYRVSSASTAILASDFTAENITFQNSSPQGEGQALAVDLRGDRMVFTNCRFVSHQDTVFCNTEGRLYFYQCRIQGDVDYIYGPATAVFEDCDIVNVRKTGGYVTAASTPEGKEFGFVFIGSRIIGDVNPGTVWLGRPWRQFAHVAYINCYMSEVVQPTGWHNWGKPDYEKTARYEEYNSSGPGANPTGRVPWSRQLTDEEASRYTVENILKGNDGWNPKPQ